MEERPVKAGAFRALRRLHGLREVALGLRDRALLEREAREAHERVVVRRVVRQHLVVDLARLLRLVSARVDGGHHVQEARLAVGRHEVDRALHLRDGVARLAGPRPSVAHAGEDLRRADVAVVAGERPEHVAALGIVNDRLELLLDLGLARDGGGDARARHLELVEERADVVAVDGPEDEFVEFEGILVPSEVL